MCAFVGENLIHRSVRYCLFAITKKKYFVWSVKQINKKFSSQINHGKIYEFVKIFIHKSISKEKKSFLDPIISSNCWSYNM